MEEGRHREMTTDKERERGMTGIVMKSQKDGKSTQRAEKGKRTVTRNK